MTEKNMSTQVQTSPDERKWKEIVAEVKETWYLHTAVGTWKPYDYVCKLIKTWNVPMSLNNCAYQFL